MICDNSSIIFGKVDCSIYSRSIVPNGKNHQNVHACIHLCRVQQFADSSRSHSRPARPNQFIQEKNCSLFLQKLLGIHCSSNWKSISVSAIRSQTDVKTRRKTNCRLQNTKKLSLLCYNARKKTLDPIASIAISRPRGKIFTLVQFKMLKRTAIYQSLLENERDWR